VPAEQPGSLTGILPIAYHRTIMIGPDSVLLWLALAFWIALWWEVFRRAGCPGYWGVLMAIPIVNFMVLIVIIAIDWPIQREVSRLRLRLGEATEPDIARVMSDANKQDQRGNWTEAIQLYNLIIENAPNSESAEDANRMIASIRAKRAAGGIHVARKMSEFKSGTHGDYTWIELVEKPWELVDLLLTHHRGCYLYITAFDSGRITPSEEDSKAGWSLQGEVMVSPPMYEDLHLPANGYDEWYVFDRRIDFPQERQVFVNYGRFSLEPVDEQLKRFDSSWEHDALDWMRPLQDQFWKQMELLNPTSYVAMGEKDLIVTKNKAFGNALKDALAIQGRCENSI
jgi:hypothetical protein